MPCRRAPLLLCTLTADLSVRFAPRLGWLVSNDYASLSPTTLPVLDSGLAMQHEAVGVGARMVHMCVSLLSEAVCIAGGDRVVRVRACIAGCRALPHLWRYAYADAGVVQRPQICSSAGEQRVAPLAAKAQQVCAGLGRAAARRRQNIVTQHFYYLAAGATVLQLHWQTQVNFKRFEPRGISYRHTCTSAWCKGRALGGSVEKI